MAFSNGAAALLFLAASSMAAGPARKMVALDGFHNNEAHPHYRWEGVYPGGFSELAAIFDRLGASRKTVLEALSAKSLAGVDCLILVDPDIPAEAANPQYISAAEADAVEKWVRQGGVLLLLGNDPGNAEFERLNLLARRFGLEFIETVHKDANGGVKLTIEAPGNHPVFEQGLKFYAVQVSPLRITNAKGKALLADNGESIMAFVPHGRGRVLALGDPWLYNEYIHTRDNYRLAESLFRWLLR